MVDCPLFLAWTPCVVMKFTFQPIFLKKLWVRVLVAAACVAIAALVVVCSPWRTQEPWTPPSGKPTTAKAPNAEKLRAVPSGLPATMEALKQEASDLAERTIEAFPYDPDSHALKGNSCYFSGRAADAVKSWEKCLELDPPAPTSTIG